MAFSEITSLSTEYFLSDEAFDQLYPPFLRELASQHWTPIQVAKKAAAFLASDKEAHILDIGSGTGKFCLSAAHFMPNAFFTGVEHRKNLVNHANKAKEKLGLSNVNFLHKNFKAIDFSEFDHFYFFNSFYENLIGMDQDGYRIDYSSEKYHAYSHELYLKLSQRPSGTKIVTYFSMEEEIPNGYKVVGEEMKGVLKFWQKS
ncbi:MAG: methyltransferase domain-containing protein [Chitinophagaceae bacterium]|nr:methyltransferase domain-containing protein [Chitinophagaceae bacterium]